MSEELNLEPDLVLYRCRNPVVLHCVQLKRRLGDDMFISKGGHVEVSADRYPTACLLSSFATEPRLLRWR